MKLSVLVPSYKRPDYLIKCLSSLEHQIRLPDEVVVVVRDTDVDTERVLQSFMQKTNLTIKKVFVSEDGVIPAENAGLKEVTGDIICFIDDDAEAFEDWLQRIEAYYLNQNIGGVGGRDCIYCNDTPWEAKKVKTVGRVAYFGRITGNHYQDVDKVQYVDFLIGLNMSFRRAIIYQIDPNIRGDGFNFEVDLGLEVKEKGYKLIFDPDIKIKHFGAPRTEGNREATPERYFFCAYNTTYIMLKHFNFTRKLLFLLYSFVVGDIASPGLIRILALIFQVPLSRQRTGLGTRFFYATKGKFNGILTYKKCRFV